MNSLFEEHSAHKMVFGTLRKRVWPNFNRSVMLTQSSFTTPVCGNEKSAVKILRKKCYTERFIRAI